MNIVRTIYEPVEKVKTRIGRREHAARNGWPHGVLARSTTLGDKTVQRGDILVALAKPYLRFLRKHYSQCSAH